MVGQVGAESAECLVDGFRRASTRSGATDAERRAQDLQERLERLGAEVRVALPAIDLQGIAGAREQLADQARLADARRPDHRDEARGARRDAVDHLGELLQLRLAADEGTEAAALARRVARFLRRPLE